MQQRPAGGLEVALEQQHALVLGQVLRRLGSQDRAPDPHDLLDSALAACTTLTLELYIRRRQLAVTALRVTVDHVEDKAADGRVRYQLQRRIAIEGTLTDADRQRLLEIADKCPIHRLLSGEIHIESALVATAG